MRLKTQKFLRKSFPVEAIQVDEDNIDDISDWCHGEVLTDEEENEYIKVKVHLPKDDKQTMAYVTDWVLHAGTGFKVYTDIAFRKSFYPE